MAREQGFQEAVVIEAVGSDDPDLNQAFWDFRESIEREANAGGSIAVFEVPTDRDGNPRPTSFQRPKLFTVPVGAMTLDDICDRVLKEFVEPGGKILVQLLARKDSERGIKMNKMVMLRRGKESGVVTGAAGELQQMMRLMNEQRERDRAEMRSMFEQLRGVGAQVAPQNQLSDALAIADRIAAMSNRVSAPAANDPNNIMSQMMAMMMSRMMKKFFDGQDEPRERSDSAGILENIRAIAAPLLQAKAESEHTARVREERMLIHERARVAQSPAAPATPEHKEPAPASPDTSKETAHMKLMALLKEALPTLVQIAASGADAKTTARLALKELPEDDQPLNDAFYSLVQEDDCVKQMAVIEPKVEKHAAWFEEFRNALCVEFDPDNASPAERAP